jgi:hypothetical protein
VSRAEEFEAPEFHDDPLDPEPDGGLYEPDGALYDPDGAL